MSLHPEWKNKLRIVTLTLLTFIAGLFLTLIIHQYELKDQDQKRAIATERAAKQIASDVQTLMASFWAFSTTLEALVHSNPSITQQQFNGFANELIASSEIIRSVALAKDNTISHIYPFELNKAAIGFNHLSDPNQRPAIEALLKSQNANIDGPMQLVEGGKAFIIRRPIYVKNDKETEVLWGIGSVVLDYQKLTEFLANHPLANNNSIQWHIFNKDTGETNITYSTLKNDTQPHSIQKVNLPSGNWHTGFREGTTSETSILSTKNGFGFLTSLLIAFLVYKLLLSHELNKKLAMYDQLTRLPNRRLLNDRFQQLSAQAIRKKIGFNLIYIDLNNFKEINDSFGHNLGDKVLQESASRLSACIRASDTIARIGGDEFVILSEVTDKQSHPIEMVDKIAKVLAKPLESIKGIELSASFGWAHFDTHGSTLTELLSYADRHMYEDKHRQKLLANSRLKDNVVAFHD